MNLRRPYVLLTAALVVATASAVPAADAGLRVVFFPVTGPDSDTNVDTVQTQLKTAFASKDFRNANPLFTVCVQDPSAAVKPTDDCSAARADVLVSTTIRKADDGSETVTLSSLDVAQRRALGTIGPRTIATKDQEPTTIPDSVKKALTLSDAEVRTLIGTPAVANGRLVLQSAGFQPFIQLIPDVASNQPNYIGVMQNLLAKRGIASVPSQFNAGTVTSGNVSADTLCGLGQRYLVYSYATRPEDRILSLNTRVETRATGHLYDCPTRSDLAFGDTARTFATNTKASLGPILSLLGSLFVSKTQSWQNATATGGLITAVVDRTPADIQDHTAEITLQKLVDNLCDRLSALPPPSGPSPTPSPSPSPTPGRAATPTPAPTETPITVQVASPAPAASASSGSSGTESSVPLDIGNFLAGSPPMLTCGPARYRIYSTPAPSSPLFHRHP
jgi:hypothetical protein